MEKTGITKWALVVASLAIGLGVGYYFGASVSYDRGIKAGIAEEQVRQEAKQKEAEKAAAGAVNPFQNTTANPYQKSPVNPYDNVKINPFK